MESASALGIDSHSRQRDYCQFVKGLRENWNIHWTGHEVLMSVFIVQRSLKSVLMAWTNIEEIGNCVPHLQCSLSHVCLAESVCDLGELQMVAIPSPI